MPQVSKGPATGSVRPRSIFFCGAQEAFRDYYNDHRVHRAIAGLTPAQFAGALSPLPLHWITTVGSSTVGACSSSRSPPDYEFATDRPWHEISRALKPENENAPQSGASL